MDHLSETQRLLNKSFKVKGEDGSNNSYDDFDMEVLHGSSS